MGYKVKWVEDNLGISRKALRNFEKYGLMPANKDARCRDYSDEDIDKIWTIRLYQGMGYSLKEIVQIAENNDFDFESSLANKIQELENKKMEIENYLGYAQNVKLTGRLPVRPAHMGTMSFEAFRKECISKWNINFDPRVKEYKELVDLFLNTPENELKDTDLGRCLAFLKETLGLLSNTDFIFAEKIIPRECASKNLVEMVVCLWQMQ